MDQKDFQNAIDAISRQIRFLGETEELIDFLTDQLSEYQELLRGNQEVIKNFNPTQESVATAQNVANDILYSQTLKAIEDSVEFDYEPFRTNLLQAVLDPKAVEVVQSGKSAIRIYFRMNEVAGSIRQWGQAVEATRRQLRISKFRKRPLDPDLASFMWMEKYYRPAREGADIEHPSGRDVDTEAYIEKYRITMQLRAENMQGLAPFWSIIDKGTRPLSSDWGGTEYPTIEPQNFLEESAKQIRTAFVEDFNRNVRYLNNAKESIVKLKELIAYINELMTEVGRAINQRIEDQVLYSPPRMSSEQRFREFTRATIEKRLKDRYKNTDQERIDLLADLLISGEEVPTRFRVGYNPTTGRAIRARTLGLQRAAGVFRARHGQ